MKTNSKKFIEHLKNIGFQKGYDKRRDNNQSGQFKKGHKTNIGKKKKSHSELARKKMSNSRKNYYLGGKRPWNWNGGPCTLNQKLRQLFEYKLWRSRVFERDKWICQTCQKKEDLEAHHKKDFIKIINEFKIISLKQAINCKELWDIDNGVTLCKDCHNLTKKGCPKK